MAPKVTNPAKRWYSYLEHKLAPTDPIANLILVILIVVSIIVLLQPSTTIKAAWLAYWISP